MTNFFVELDNGLKKACLYFATREQCLPLHYYLFCLFLSAIITFYSFLRIFSAFKRTHEIKEFTRKVAAYQEIETAMPGSDFITKRTIPGVFGVYLAWPETGTRMPIGTAFKVTHRKKHYIFTAAHVLTDTADIVLSYRVDDEIHYLTKDIDEWTFLAGDVAVLELERTDRLSSFPSLKVGTALGMDVFATSALKDRNHSAGQLRNPMAKEKSIAGFGRVVYTGSTRPGFSGAPYVTGTDMVLGMHTNGGRMNTGYSITYMLSILDMHTRPEDDTPKFHLRNALKKARSSDVDFVMVAPGEYQVRVGNRYHFIEEDLFNQVSDEYGHFFDQEQHPKRRDEYRESLFEKFLEAQQKWPAVVSTQESDTVNVENYKVLIDAAVRKVEEKFMSSFDSFLEIYNDRVKFLTNEIESLKRQQVESSLDKQLEEQKRRQESFQDETVEELNQLHSRIKLLEKTSPSLELENRIESCSMNIDSIVDMLTSLQKDMHGQDRLIQSLTPVSPTTVSLDNELVQAMSDQLQQSTKQLVEDSLLPIRTDITNLQAQTMKISTDISTLYSEPSKIKPAQQGSESSPATLPLPQRWDGMDVAFEQFKKWRSSVDTSKPEYVTWRETYLRSLNLELWQQRALVKRLSNQLTSTRRKLQKNIQVTSEERDQAMYWEPVFVIRR